MVNEDWVKRFRRYYEKEAPLLHRRLLEYLQRTWGIRDPVVVLRECIENREWFKGIVLSTAFLEGLGKYVVTSYFKGRIRAERIEHLRLEQIIILLYASRMIDHSIYVKMMKIKDFRNRIVHIEPFAEPNLQSKKAKQTIEKAIFCFESLVEWLPKIAVAKLRKEQTKETKYNNHQPKGNSFKEKVNQPKR
jgi:hypothetical protein